MGKRLTIMRYILLFLLFWSAVSDFFSSLIAPLGYLDEVIILLFLIDIFLHSVVKVDKQRTDVQFTKGGIFILLLLSWSLLSFIVNFSSIPQLFKFLLSISKGFILFYWVKIFLNDKLLFAQVVNIIKFLVLIQVPFFIIGFLISGSGYIGDNAVGAFITGDASLVGTYFWLAIFTCLALYTQVGQKKYLLFSIVLLMFLIVTSTKQLTLLLPVVLIYLYGRKIKIQKIRQTAFVVIAVTVALILYAAVERKWMQNYGVDTSETSMIDYLDESEKLLGYYSVVYELPQEIAHPLLFGAGPGMYGTYVAMNARTPLAQKYIMHYYDLIPEDLGGTLAYRSSSIIGWWGDIGLFGLIIGLITYIYHAFHWGKKMKRLQEPVIYSLIIASGILLLAQSFILNVLEGNSFTINLFWILSGIAASRVYELKPHTEAI